VKIIVYLFVTFGHFIFSSPMIYGFWSFYIFKLLLSLKEIKCYFCYRWSKHDQLVSFLSFYCIHIWSRLASFVILSFFFNFSWVSFSSNIRQMIYYIMRSQSRIIWSKNYQCWTHNCWIYFRHFEITTNLMTTSKTNQENLRRLSFQTTWICYFWFDHLGIFILRCAPMIQEGVLRSTFPKHDPRHSWTLYCICL
jgi:hypothetical protein